MDHQEAIRQFEHLMEKQAQQAHNTALELETLIPHISHERTRQLAQMQIKASHELAREFRELAQKVKEK